MERASPAGDFRALRLCLAPYLVELPADVSGGLSALVLGAAGVGVVTPAGVTAAGGVVAAAESGAGVSALAVGIPGPSG